MDSNTLTGSTLGDSTGTYQQKELTIRDLTVIFRRRRKIVYSVMGGLTLLVAIYCIFCTRRYEATATIQVQGKDQDGLALDSMAGASSSGDSDALTENITIQTQAEILQSDSLALRTIDELHMEGTHDFKPIWNPIGWAMGLISPSGIPDPAHASLEDSPLRRRHALLVFSSHLKVLPVPATRLISISYSSPDPKLAAAVVNKLTEGLIDYSFQTRFDATNQAAGWLNGQLADLRHQSEDMEKKVTDVESKSGVYSIGTVDSQGKTQAYSDVVEKLQEATTAVSQAEQNRIMRGAILQAARSGDADTLSGLAGNTANGSNTNNSLTLIQNLRAQQASQQATLQQMELKFGRAYPKLDEMRGNIAGLQRSIQQELDRLKQRAQSDYDNAVLAENASRSQYNQLKGQADTLNSDSVNFAILRQEANQSRSLYQEILTKFKEAGVMQGLKGSTITVVDPGRAPGKPKTPNVPLYLGIAIVAGFFFGSCAALVIDTTDQKINTIGEVERISGGNLLGVTPIFQPELGSSGQEGAPALASLEEPRSPFVEAARTIRTEIFLQGGANSSKVILVTSSIPGEGKTILSANLAVLLAQASKRVLLIDTDLRLGTLASALNLPFRTGLSELLTGTVRQPEIHAVANVSNLDALQAGAAPDNPSELLGSSAFGQWLSVWRQEYDYIVLDSAPLLPVTDSLTLAPLSDMALLVARPGLTERSQMLRSYQLLTRSGTHFVAAVLNGLPPEEEGYSSYFGYPAAGYGEDAVKKVSAKWKLAATNGNGRNGKGAGKVQ